MKKIAISMALILGTIMVMVLDTTRAFAQDLTSSKGEKYLPEKGDWEVGFSAVPVFNTISHLFGGSSEATNPGNPYGPIGAATTSANYIMGKYFINDNTAIRAAIGINIISTTVDSIVTDQTAPVTGTGTPPTVTDKWTHTSSSFSIGAGIEKRKGKTRLQGYYGGMLMINFGNEGKDKYTYGNTLSSTVQKLTTDFGQPQGLQNDNTGSLFGIGISGFLGVEYFILPKISIGAEYWYGLNINTVGQGSQTFSVWNTSLQSYTLNTGGNSTVSLGNSVAAVMINFHF